MASHPKILWYARNLLNFTIASVRIFFYCLLHLRKGGQLAFAFFSLINEFYQSSHGHLHNFEATSTFEKIKSSCMFAQSNYFSLDRQVARPTESQVLAGLTKYFNPATVFEIGTYNGFTTLHFAYNTSERSRIYTLDLPPDSADNNHQGTHYSYDDLLVLQLSRATINKRIYRSHPQQRKITELFGNSINFDFRAYYGTMDLVFIDGSHSYSYVQSDTANAFKMLSPNGIILWHDYDYIIHRDVFRFLNGLSKEHLIHYIPNTRFAIYGKNL